MRALAARLARLEQPAYAALRIVAGAAFAFHGMQKIFGWYAQGRSFAPFSQLWIGGIIELVCGTLIALGLFARPAAFLASGTMAVAYMQFHWKLAFAAGMWLPAINKGEPALIYCFLFLFFATRGPGPTSIDARLGRGRG
ncbi:MAG: DoxX family protein [Labilithrix sp.]|nr:DoxX family protein [Labilithrix sp.]